MSISSILERQQNTTAKRSQALKQTLDELQLIESQNSDGAYNDAIKSLREKRDRQEQAVRSSQQLETAFGKLKPKK